MQSPNRLAVTTMQVLWTKKKTSTATILLASAVFLLWAHHCGAFIQIACTRPSQCVLHSPFSLDNLTFWFLWHSASSLHFLFVVASLSATPPPPHWPKMYDVSPLSGISWLSIWSHFSLSPLLFFCLVLLLFVSYPFLLLAHSPDSFCLNLHFSKGRLFCVAPFISG